MFPSPYQIDVDVQLVPGRGYAASYVIAGADGTVVHRRLIARRFAAYSEAMGCALDLAKATVAALELPANGFPHASHSMGPSQAMASPLSP
jgi:hypothetical protein